MKALNRVVPGPSYVCNGEVRRFTYAPSTDGTRLQAICRDERGALIEIFEHNNTSAGLWELRELISEVINFYKD